MNILVILGSVREGRAGINVANWFLPIAKQYGEVDFADLKEVDLPYEMEAVIPSAIQDFNYNSPQTKAWSERVRAADAVIFITPEYNHAVTAPMKNAIDHLYSEWFDKPVGFVGYGARGAEAALQSINVTMERLKWDAVLEPRVAISEIWAAFDEEGNLNNAEEHEDNAKKMLETLTSKVQ